MRNIKITIEYDGTAYAGWQRQNNAVAVQQVIEQAIQALTGVPTVIAGSGRTDAGVHAHGQVASFKTTSRLHVDAIKRALNHYLPADVVITDACEVPDDFHARFSARSKTYRYVIFNRDCPSALERKYSFYVPHRLDFEKMRRGASHFVGIHDFQAFCVKSALNPKETYVREIFALDVCRQGPRMEVFVTGSGFLYRMVRSIVGTLVDIGRGRIEDPDSVKDMIASKKRCNCGVSAPACGLFLHRVEY